MSVSQSICLPAVNQYLLINVLLLTCLFVDLSTCLFFYLHSCLLSISLYLSTYLAAYLFFSNIFWGIFFFLFVQYSALLHLPPLRFHTVSWRIRIFNCIEEVPRFFFAIEFNSTFQISNYLQFNCTPDTI